LPILFNGKEGLIMNKAIFVGRLTRDPELKTALGEKQQLVAKYILAVPRFISSTGVEDADFIPCVAFSKAAEWASKYLKQGTKIIVSGRIQTGSYTKDNHMIYTTDLIIESQEFAESKSARSSERLENQDIPISDELPTEEV
jgi:single-strand DNA-binding protein